MTSVESDHNARIQQYLVAKEAKDVPTLIRFLADSDLRLVAAGELGRLGAQEAVVPVSMLLTASDPATRIAGLSALTLMNAGEMSSRIGDIARCDTLPSVRTWATFALGYIGSRGAREELKRVLQDSDGDVRLWAALLLLRLEEDPEAHQIVATAGWRKRRQVRRAIARAEKRARRKSILGL